MRCMRTSRAALTGKKSRREMHEWHEGDGADQIFQRAVPEHRCAGPTTNTSVSWKAVERFVTGWEIEAGEGERLIGGLACIRMWLMVGLWEGYQSPWLCLSIPLSVCLSVWSAFTLCRENLDWLSRLPHSLCTGGFSHIVRPRRMQPPVRDHILNHPFPSPHSAHHLLPCPTSFLNCPPEGQSCCWCSLQGGLERASWTSGWTWRKS